jgi:hypothetical protein
MGAAGGRINASSRGLLRPDAGLSVALGTALDLLEAHTLFSGSKDRALRLRGATNAGWLAFLGFVGFAVALHEAIRRRRADFAGLAALNVLLTILSGGRMG